MNQGKKSIEQFLESSDFNFELNILNLLHTQESLPDNSFQFEHGGTYKDPLKGVYRQFDFRAGAAQFSNEQVDEFQFRVKVCLAIECKNLSDKKPLLITCIPRKSHEAYQDVIFRSHQVEKVLRMDDRYTRYSESSFVGKSSDQVSLGRGGVTGDDSDIYGKWSQAIASAYDLIENSISENIFKFDLFLILPVLVVPNGTLWKAQYDQIGTQIEKPERTDYIPFYIGVDNQVLLKGQFENYSFSHLEIMTENGLIQFLKELSMPGNVMDPSGRINFILRDIFYPNQQR